MIIIKKICVKIFNNVKALLFLPFWWLERLIPRDKRIFIFGSWFGTRYSDNTRALFEYIINNVPQIKPYWITHSKKIYQKLLNEDKPVLMAYSLKGWLISLRASLAFTACDENDINKYALNGAKQVWLWHGMPLKKIRADNKDYLYYPGKTDFVGKFQRLKRKLIRPYLDFKKIIYATIASSEFFVPFLQSAFLLEEKDVWLTGLPRTDYFYTQKEEKIVGGLRKKYPGSRIVLFMPTWRYFSEEVPYNPFAVPSFNKDAFMDFLEKENVVFLYKSHFYDQDIDLSSAGRFLVVKDDDYNELYTLVSNIDILVTDYSSIYFDFLTLNKPSVLIPFDYDAYIKESREHYFDYNLLPSIKAYSWDEFMSVIAEKKYYSPSKEEADIFCKYNDGHASERCLQKTIELLHSLT